GARDDRPRRRRERSLAALARSGARRRARAAGPRPAPEAGDGGAARNLADGRPHARHPGTVLPGDRRPAPAARRHGQVAHQSRPHRARAADPETARRRLRTERDAQTHGSLLMNVKTETVGGIGIVRVGETRLMYPILSDFSSAVTGLMSTGK